jgi:RimJ/RimL family protein N-acetyltransferase
MIDEMIAGLATNGYGFLAVERKSDGAFIGETGLAPIDQLTKDALHRPADVEIGWMFGKEYWGQGYAPEAAQAWLSYAWENLCHLPEIIAFTYVGNLPSQRVMQKIGMTCDPADEFEDPTVPVGHYQRPHLVYRAHNPKRR